MLNDTKKEYAVILKIATVVVISAAVVKVLYDKFTDLSQILSELTDYPELISVMAKGVIICIVTAVCSDICTESGNVAIAKTVQFTGRVMILILAYPIIEAVIKTAISFAGG